MNIWILQYLQTNPLTCVNKQICPLTKNEFPSIAISHTVLNFITFSVLSITKTRGQYPTTLSFENIAILQYSFIWEIVDYYQLQATPKNKLVYTRLI